MPMETTCVQPKFSSFVQISFTLTGLLVTRSGGNFAGKKTSLMRSPNPPKFVPQLTASRLFTGPFGMGRELKNSLKFSKNPPPYDPGITGDRKFPLIFTGRPVRNSFTFHQN